jgi:hypothetical protein
LERLHLRALDRIPSGPDRLTLETCHLEHATVGGWPTWALLSTAGLPLPQQLQNAYRAALLEVLSDAASALLIPWPDGGELADTWATALARLDLPSTRLLLGQQARLVGLDRTTATVEVQPTWLAMVSARRDLIATALGAVIGRPVTLALTSAEVGQ